MLTENEAKIISGGNCYCNTEHLGHIVFVVKSIDDCQKKCCNPPYVSTSPIYGLNIYAFNGIQHTCPPRVELPIVPFLMDTTSPIRT